MVPARTFEAAPGVTAIDTMMVGKAMVTCAYLVAADEPILVETGPTTSLPSLVAGLDAVGVGPADLPNVVVTHIHLDHAGGVGALAERFPGATIWVHERGAPHLADPTRLIASAVRVYGADRLASMFGSVDPVPAERIRALVDGDTISLGDRALEVMHTPGHASHHICLRDDATAAVFTGDGFGVYLPDVGVLRPATAPPEFDLEVAVADIERVRAASPSALLFSHFGPATDVEAVCDLAIERLRGWTELVRAALDRPGGDEASAAEIGRFLRDATASETSEALARGLDVERYDFLSSYEMNAAGIMRYLRGRPAAGA